jgi:predicted outer membrane protein
MTRLTLLSVAAVTALWLSGCGQESRHDVLQQSFAQIASIAAEGSLMADDVARDRTKVTFVRVHGNDLSAQAQHEAEKLNDAPAPPDLKGHVQVAIKLAADIGGAIDDLRTSPQDRAQARQARGKLSHWAAEMRRLERDG